MKNLKIIIADDSSMLRDGIKNVLQKLPFIKDIKEAGNGDQVIDLVEKIKTINLILMGDNLPLKNGIETTKYIKRNFPSTKVIALTGRGIHFIGLFKMLHAGADAYITKHTAADELLHAINEVSEGRNYFSKDIPDILKLEIDTKYDAMKIKSIANSLTGREKEILILICNGNSNDEIREKLFISLRTVEKHREHVMEKTKSKNLAELIFFALEAEII